MGNCKFADGQDLPEGPPLKGPYHLGSSVPERGPDLLKLPASMPRVQEGEGRGSTLSARSPHVKTPCFHRFGIHPHPLGGRFGLGKY